MSRFAVYPFSVNQFEQLWIFNVQTYRKNTRHSYYHSRECPYKMLCLLSRGWYPELQQNVPLRTVIKKAQTVHVTYCVTPHPRLPMKAIHPILQSFDDNLSNPPYAGPYNYCNTISKFCQSTLHSTGSNNFTFSPFL